MKITKSLVKKIHSALDKGLTEELGNPIEGEMCVEALICHVLGEPHTDSPSCVGDAIRKAILALNDCAWTSNRTRAEGMRKLAIAQLGSVSLNQEDFFNLLKLRSTQRILPFLIQSHIYFLAKEDKTRDLKLKAFKLKFEKLKKLDTALWKEFYNYYSSRYYRSSYYYYSYYYNYSNYYSSYNYNFYYYNYNKDYYYRYYYSRYNYENLLLLIADVILQALIEMKSPGCKYL